MNSRREESSDGVGDGFRQIGEQLRHFLAAISDVTLGVAGEQAAGGHQRALVADGGEDVAELAVVRGGVADAVGGEQRKMQVAGDFDGDAVAGFFFAVEVALQFDVDIVGAEDAGEAIDCASGFGRAAFL